jgi:hypothetical protein
MLRRLGSLGVRSEALSGSLRAIQTYVRVGPRAGSEGMLAADVAEALISDQDDDGVAATSLAEIHELGGRGVVLRRALGHGPSSVWAAVFSRP